MADATTWQRRIDNHVRHTGRPRSLFVAEDGRCVGIWWEEGEVLTGALLRNWTESLLFDSRRVADYFNLYGAPDATQRFAQCDLVHVDVPFPVEDPNHYEPPTVKRRAIVQHLAGALRPGARVAWLDQTLPMYRKDQWAVEAAIGVIKSPDHRFRGLTVFRRL